MATYYVQAGVGSGGNGSSGNPFKDINAADAAASPGDTIRVRPGKYASGQAIYTNNTTWLADTPSNRPVIDGGYHIGLAVKTFNGQKNAMPAPTGSTTCLRIKGDNVTVDGFVCQNSEYHGIGISGDNVTVKNCTTYFTYVNGIFSNANKPGGTIGLTIENCQIYMASIRYTAGPTGAGPTGEAGQQGGAGMLLGDMRPPVHVNGLTVGYCFGEGLDIDKGSRGTEQNPLLFENLRLFNCNHTPLYFNRTAWVVVRNFVSYFTDVGITVHGGEKGLANVCLRVKDETEKSGVRTENIAIYNGIVVNGGGLISWGGGSGTNDMNGARVTETRNFYLGHVTAVVGPHADQPAILIGANPGREQQGLLENCIFDNSIGENFPLSKTSGTVKVVTRNNNWHTPPSSYFAEPTNVVGSPGLVNPTKVLRTTGYPNPNAVNYSQFNPTDNFNANDYRPTAQSPGINKGSTAGSAGGTTVPSQARQKDYGGANRSGVPDIGAWEYGGVIVDPPDGEVFALFSASDTSVLVGETVSFTDNSSATGDASISKRTWYFGDGATSSATNPTHTYNQPGSYVVRLVVEDTSLFLSSEYQVTINVDTAVSPPGGGVVFATARVVLPTTSTAGQTITAPELDGLVPKSARLYLTRTTANNTAVSGEMLSIGFFADAGQSGGGTKGNAISTSTKHGSAATVAKTFMGSESGMILSDPDFGAFGAMYHVEWVPNGMVVSYSVVPGYEEPFLLTVVFCAGNQYHARVIETELNNTGVAPIISPGFSADVATFLSSSRYIAINDQDSIMSIGYADRNGNSAAVMRYAGSGISPIRYTESLNGSEVSRRPSGDGYSIVKVQSFTSAGVTLEVTENDFNAPIAVLMESFGESRAKVGVTNAQAAANVLGWQPQYIEHVVTWRGAEGIGSNNKAGTIGVHVAVDGEEYTNLISGRHNVTPAESRGMTSDSITVLNNIGTVSARGTTSFSGTGYSYNWTTGPYDNYFFIYLAVEVGYGEGETLVADFEASTLFGQPPLTVQFTNLSSPSATSFLWDFGDGGISTQENPSHTYYEEGTFAVTLTVSDGTNEATKVEVAYITTLIDLGASGVPFIIGPYKFRIDSGVTSPIVYSHPEDEEAGTVVLPSGSSGTVYIPERAAAPVPRAGHSSLWVDSETKQLVMTTYDGVSYAIPAIEIIPEGGGGDPPVLEAIDVSSTIENGNRDAQQDGATVSVSSTRINQGSLNQLAIFIFPLDVPNGASIQSASVNWNFTNEEFSTPDITIRGQAAGNAADATTANNDISSRPTTDSFVTWVVTEPLGTGGKSSPDIKSIIQEIVSRPDWVQGNKVAIITSVNQSSSKMRVNAYEAAGEKSHLNVRYVNYG
jgi:PKD repeat protein